MTNKKVLIADDEPLARERIHRLVDALPEFTVCAEASDGHEALSLTAEHGPDVVLLDIRMPGMDGLEAAERLSALEQPPAIIFCTAYDHYAITAFEVQAVAYLLKPVRREALADALTKAGRVNRLQLQSIQSRDQESGAQLAIRTHRGTELIDLAQVFYCEADQKYVTIHHHHGESVTDHTLKELEGRFPDELLRIHRHTLVGVRHIQGLTRNNDGHWFLNLSDRSTALPVSRRHAGSVREWLEKHRPL
ncbi:LytR/AlgR family response regulator transcription factor [Marinobacter zhejiangensis]|uniref:Two component transcriptional regulator, LytTR family n=1 Tax=Marinobacter zhejiangensis TaxID=488535 RepID=A0A1I4MDM4_9GAMM|nr:LytTR family DNA-binding domain-containing protein [Marinobacter zhejiangensis]SFM01299.1 two component transcriptional regulator, LytTR family [Marinobacter zhejiangensis]